MNPYVKKLGIGDIIGAGQKRSPIGGIENINRWTSWWLDHDFNAQSTTKSASIARQIILANTKKMDARRQSQSRKLVLPLAVSLVCGHQTSVLGIHRRVVGSKIIEVNNGVRIGLATNYEPLV